MKTFHLTIARVGESVFDGEVVSVTLPGTEGAFTVLANHEPLVATLGKGSLVLGGVGRLARPPLISSIPNG